MPSFNPQIAAHLGLIFVIFNMLVLSAAFMVWMERKVCAYIQDRKGPNRVGFEGLLQPFADVIKLMFKEQLRPKAADALLFVIAPVISTCAAFAAFSVIPFGTETTLFGLLAVELGVFLTASSGAGLACGTWPGCNGSVWFPTFAGPVGLQVLHRAGAYAVFDNLAILQIEC